jgi:Domain of Unknown Function (DUF1080)
MKLTSLFTTVIILSSALMAFGQETSSPKGQFTKDVHQDIGPGNGVDSKKWLPPQPVFAEDLSNAIYKPGTWSWINGVLTSVEKNGGDIWTKDTYGDFVLNLDFRCHEKTNSGVYLRSSDIVHWLHNTIEVQILQEDDSNDKHIVGAIYDCLAPSHQIEIAPYTWHHYLIIAKGKTIKVSLDGEEIINMNLNKWTSAHKNPDGTKNKFNKAYKDMDLKGHIGLQFHTHVVEFKNIVVDKI